MERELLSRVTGSSFRQQRLQGQQDPRPPPSPSLSLHLGWSQEERQSRGADATIRGHARARVPQQPHHAPSPAADMAASLPTTSSRAPLASDRLASVVVPGYPMAQRRHNLRAGAGDAPAQACAPRGPPDEPAPRRPPTVPGLPTLQLVDPTAAARGTGQERCCGACGLSGQLLWELSSDLDRARAQVALLTCQNESLRSRLKRAAAAAEPASSARLDLRCGACRVSPATVVLVPREHLCLCGRCGSDATAACSVCRAADGTGPPEAACPSR